MQTFGDAQLRDAAKVLLRLIDESGFRPDIVVSISTGGTQVVQAIAAELASRNVPTVAVLCQRTTTPMKGNPRFRAWLNRLPLSARNFLRIVEHYVNVMLGRVRVGGERAVSVVSPGVLAGQTYSRILIIDDATDSGRTLWAVQEYLRGEFPSADIRCGVLTQTRGRAAIVPEFSVYKSLLIRFPWSNDFRASDVASETPVGPTPGD